MFTDTRKDDDRFSRLGIDSAPGQEVRQDVAAKHFRGKRLPGIPVDFSHGDVDAFAPQSQSIGDLVEGFHEGGSQAYTEYRGKLAIRELLSKKLGDFTGAPVAPDRELILTPGTQGALFLAAGACINRGDQVVIVEPDYFANRKLVEFYEGQIQTVSLDFMEAKQSAGLDLDRLESCFRSGAKVFIFSNPNNPAGVVYSPSEVIAIARLAEKYGTFVIVDQLYSRQIFEGYQFTHLRSLDLMPPDNLLTIMGPSKTESLSGFRLGVAFGASNMIGRMEKLQAIVSLRAAGYCQSVLKSWFSEPDGWLDTRIAQHQSIRDDLCRIFMTAKGFRVRSPGGGSYLFPQMPKLEIDIAEFVRALRALAGVIVTPGSEFGAPFANHFRINFSQNHDAAVQAVERLVAIADRYRA